MSKKGGLDMEYDKKGSEKNNEKRVCPFCPKEFSSGKALGGHMRIHVQNNNPKKTRFKNGDDVTTPIFCAICSRNFLSWKSLYGHMRCHPERGWRGTIPPPPPPPPHHPSSSSDASGVVDLAATLKAWPVTAERGRTRASSEVSSSSEDHELLDAVNHLLMLSRGAPKKKRIRRKKLSDLEPKTENKVKIGIIDPSDNSPVCRRGLPFDLNELPLFDVN